MSVQVPVKEYIASLEMNAMIVVILALNMKNFATQIIQHVNSGGLLDETGLAALKAKCVRSLRDIAIEGATLEQKTKALDEAFILFGQMVDDAVLRGRAEGKNRPGG